MARLGVDIGSRIAQAIARHRPDLVQALVLTPPLPGIGERILAPAPQQEFWYLPFHQLPIADQLIDGRPDTVRRYLRHFWTHWSGPDYTLTDDHLDHLVSVYADPGAFTASIGWYRVGAGGFDRVVTERAPPPAERITVPTTVLWPDHDPLFPTAWSDRLDQFFADVRLQHVNSGHFLRWNALGSSPQPWPTQPASHPPERSWWELRQPSNDRFSPRP